MKVRSKQTGAVAEVSQEYGDRLLSRGSWLPVGSGEPVKKTRRRRKSTTAIVEEKAVEADKDEE
jgi:hypothetical protein